MEESAKKSFRKVGLRYGATLDRINDSRTSGKTVSRSSKKSGQNERSRNHDWDLFSKVICSWIHPNKGVHRDVPV